MNLNGSGGPAAQTIRPDEGARTQPELGRPGSHPRPARAAASGLLAPRAVPVPGDAPEGTDPELWAVLTSEERSFFSRMHLSGPLTYGRKAVVAHTQAPLARGGRIDVRA
jgi:hypothetical protein